ncbi:MAG: N-acetyl sugar amidotransferase [Rhodospirillaceae bacterium]|nr:N-acetyl sugar amidotransferase [Rhodospirillaceae bacterium]
MTSERGQGAPRLRYCRRCGIAETRPHLRFDEETICSACRAYERRPAIAWEDRQRRFLDLVEQYRSKDGSNWDCIVPVSGGKDSHYQTLMVLEMGLNPLIVMATTDKLSDIGRRNFDNLKKLGVDAIEVDVNPVVRRKLNRIALMRIGDISWPEHVTIFTVPVRLSVQLNIPLVIWGENTEDEYGGPDEAASEYRLINRSWLEEFGGMNGLRVADMVGQLGITQRDLIAYTYPAADDLERTGSVGVYLGYFFPWDGLSNAILAKAYGFETYGKTVEGSLVDYENLDNYQTGIHDYFMYLKYGFGRAAMLASLHVRRGRLSRRQAMDLVRRHDGRFPSTYLGHPLEEILRDIGMSLEQFQGICDRFTNRRIFRQDNNGRFIRDEAGRLVKFNDDNPEDAEG